MLDFDNAIGISRDDKSGCLFSKSDLHPGRKQDFGPKFGSSSVSKRREGKKERVREIRKEESEHRMRGEGMERRTGERERKREETGGTKFIWPN